MGDARIFAAALVVLVLVVALLSIRAAETFAGRPPLGSQRYTWRGRRYPETGGAMPSIEGGRRPTRPCCGPHGAPSPPRLQRW